MTTPDEELLARFQMAALTGLCANPNLEKSGIYVTAVDVAEESVKVGKLAFAAYKKEIGYKVPGTC